MQKNIDWTLKKYGNKKWSLIITKESKFYIATTFFKSELSVSS